MVSCVIRSLQDWFAWCQYTVTDRCRCVASVSMRWQIHIYTQKEEWGGEGGREGGREGREPFLSSILNKLE